MNNKYDEKNIKNISIVTPKGIKIVGEPVLNNEDSIVSEIDLINLLNENFKQYHDMITNGMNDSELKAYDLCFKNTMSFIKSITEPLSENEWICIRKKK